MKEITKKKLVRLTVNIKISYMKVSQNKVKLCYLKIILLQLLDMA